MDLGEWGIEGGSLEGLGRGKTIVGIYCLKNYFQFKNDIAPMPGKKVFLFKLYLLCWGLCESLRIQKLV